MTSIKTLAIATLPVLALLVFPQGASARGGVSFRSGGPNQLINTQATFNGNIHNTNGGLNTNLIQLPPTKLPPTFPPRQRTQPRTM
ncbi:MAG TPA: hypothetical protein VKX28_20795 [Xanthobacteraceae bacterium]|nr:hypothetical protein [Xanthobacteraceae bacterium]